MFSKSINLKLMILFFTVGVSALFIIGTYSYFNSKNALLRRTLDQLTSIRVIKKEQIEFFFNERFTNITLLSRNDYLQKFISDKTIPGKLPEPVNNNKPAYFNSIKEKLSYSLGGFDNIYLVLGTGKTSPEIYRLNSSEINKEVPDSFTINQLSKLWEKTVVDTIPSIVDFRKPFSDDKEPSCFIGKLIDTKNIKYKGVLAIPIPIQDINNIMLEDNPENGLGKSGEVYLVGDDFLMRSNSRFIPNSVLNTFVNTVSAKNAFENKIGASIVEDYRSITCLSSFDRLAVPGLNWVIIAEIDYREAMIPIISIRNDIFFLSIVICVFLFSISHFISRNITNPVIKLKNAAVLIGEGSLDVTLKSKTNDEIGLLFDAFNTMALQLKEERLKRMSALYDGQELERQRISRELHDGLGQKLIAIKLQLESTTKQDIDETRSTLEDVKGNFLKTIEEVRQISNNLAPNILKESGIDVAIKNLCDSIQKSANIDVEFSVYGNSFTSDPKGKFYIYRIAQEGLNNAVKHSGATRIQTHLIENKENILLIIEDNGKGFIYDSNLCSPCNGIYNMKERALMLNGSIIIESEPLIGTTIRLKIPKDVINPV
jgi:signal transduction histidine kinase